MAKMTMGKMTMAKPSSYDRTYYPESDARTLVEAHKIKSDKKRHGAAKKHLRDQAAAARAALADTKEDRADKGVDEASETT